jgi:hypothetical protein
MTPLETAAIAYVRAMEYFDAVCRVGFPQDVIDAANDATLEAWDALEKAVDAAAPLQSNDLTPPSEPC